MDVLSTAITLVQGVRMVVAALKGESRMVLSSRQLMHSCQLYEDIIKTLQVSMEEKQKRISNKVDGISAADLQNSINKVNIQVEDDTELLKSILKQTQSIAESTEKKGFIHNVIITAVTKRATKIKELSDELNQRVQLIAALMQKDIWKATSGLNSELMDIIGDVDGSVFWCGEFDSARQVSFGVFVESYQSYLTQTFLFRKLDRTQLVTLLRHSLLEETGTSDAALMTSEVSVARFALWLRRFGPMKDTLTKSCVVSQPKRGVPAPWFHKGMSRDSASALINNNMAKYVHGIDPHDLVAVRYSSDPKNHFVVTTRPPNLNRVEHFPVVNTPLGYCVLGETDAQPTVLDCVQRHVLDRLFASAMKTAVNLARDNQDEWEAIFSAVQAELPADYYPSVEALDAAAAQLDLGESVGSKPKNTASFHSLMGIAALPASAYCPPGAPSASQQPSQLKEQLNAQQANKYDEISSYSRTAAASYAAKSLDIPLQQQQPQQTSGAGLPVLRRAPAEQPLDQKVVVGQYMINHGLALLLEAGRLSEQQASLIRDLI